MIDYELRKSAMSAAYVAGVRLPQLARMYGLTHQRAHQILEETGVLKARRERIAQRRQEKQAKRIGAAAEFERRKVEAVEMVRRGISITKACRVCRLSYGTVQKAVRAEGVEPAYGRWRDFASRRARTAELVADGKKPHEIVSILAAENKNVSLAWVRLHFAGEIRVRGAANDNVITQKQAA